MHYYQFNIGDYAKATRHLTNLEDLAYRRLIELYYDTEKPLCNDVKKLSRLINMRENQAEIETVLEDFFTETEEGFFQSRIEEEIAAYKEKAEKARVNGKKGGRPKKANANPEESGRKAKKTQSVILANPEESGSKTNHKPITNNHKPITNSKETMSTGVDLVQGLFDFWVNQMRKQPGSTKLTTKRRKAIQARLKEGYTEEQIKNAIVGCSLDPFSMGQNDRQKAFNDIELICRSGEKLESFFNQQPISQPSCSRGTQQALEVIANMEYPFDD